MLYRRLEKGEIVQAGDEFDGCGDPWRDDAVWVPATAIGHVVSDPNFVSHGLYRRPLKAVESRKPRPTAATRKGAKKRHTKRVG